MFVISRRYFAVMSFTVHSRKIFEVDNREGVTQLLLVIWQEAGGINMGIKR
jgi:hypothetical protein